MSKIKVSQKLSLIGKTKKQIACVKGLGLRRINDSRIVEDTPDVLAIQNTNHYNGLFHVIGGLISPIDGIGPENLNIDSLEKRVEEGEIEEIIFALSPTLDGDTTSFYISKRLSKFNLRITTISRGIPIGGEIEYADEVTLGKSISSRINYNIEK